MEDMDVLEFARKISMLPIDTPLSKKFDDEYGQKDKKWWSCQREHMTVWCLHYPTNGVQGFEHNPCNSAKKMYNGFSRPETLLWLAEALGEDSNVIQSIIDKVKEVHNCRSACSIVRESIPFDRILELLLEYEKEK